MKTLDEIINRNDYIHINGALAERTGELAVKVAEKMQEIEARCIGINDKYELRRISISPEFGYGQILSIREKNTPRRFDYVLALTHGSNTWQSATGFGEDDYTDIYEAGTWAKLLFLNNCLNIINAIDELETRKTKEIETALESVKNL